MIVPGECSRGIMRLWSIHPKYLDARGLTALWREGLLALKVLEGKSKGYTNHPQLLRFKAQKDPVISINAYLLYVLEEAEARGYKFDRNKLGRSGPFEFIQVTSGQLEFELQHLLSKLRHRSPFFYNKIKKVTFPEPHPVMTVIPGPVEPWEKIRD